MVEYDLDQLEAKAEILYELVSLRHVHLILIGNEYERLFSWLDERVTSKLCGRQSIEFEPYELEILVEILRKRCEGGLRSGSIAPGVLEGIAETAASRARGTIQILCEAATIAELQSGTITTDCIPEVEPKACE